MELNQTAAPIFEAAYQIFDTSAIPAASRIVIFRPRLRKAFLKILPLRASAYLAPYNLSHVAGHWAGTPSL
jgi:hypothetical protein